MGFNINIVVYLLMLVIEQSAAESCEQGYCSRNETEIHEDTSRVLLRRKRFLLFPDGSSFQLVFCVQTSAIITIGDIFLYGNTAALAWTLPSDPEIFHRLKENTVLRRQDDPNNFYYLDDEGKVVKIPYRKPFINPVFAKRSVDEEPKTFKEKLKIKIDKKRMHEKQMNRDYLKYHFDKNTIEFHRRTRVELYEKLEKLYTALGKDGRQCVLHKVCEAAQSNAQGSFLQEFLRVVFTLPKGKPFDFDEHKEYDDAHKMGQDCGALYPNCEDIMLFSQHL